MIQLDKNDELREWMKQANTLREIYKFARYLLKI